MTGLRKISSGSFSGAEYAKTESYQKDDNLYDRFSGQCDGLS